MNREPFLASIQSREPGARKVFADWLEENGQCEEADMQRAAARLDDSPLMIDGRPAGLGKSIRLALLPVPSHIAARSGQWDEGSMQSVSSIRVMGHSCAVVSSVFCGKHMPDTLYIPAELAPGLLPKEDCTELSREQRIVLAATRGLKSSHAGVKDYRFSEAHRSTGISREQWETAKAELISAGYLNKVGAITDRGRNAIGRTDLFSLRPAETVEV